MKIITTILFSLLLVQSSVSLAISNNQLVEHPSPYLAMHGNDPVDWKTWDKKVFERAKKENKLVFVSIGYFACHWCHVMQRESYQNTEIAKFMNKEFLSIKVDRELQPALDARLIEFVERTRGYAGWPLNVFITPDGYPLLGIVYMPPKEFKELAENLAKAWKEDPASMAQIAKNAADSMKKPQRVAGEAISKELVGNYINHYLTTSLQNADHLQGGFGEQSKFPLVPQLQLLLELYKTNKDDKVLEEFLLLTLDKMASRGLYDHLRGGFYRYVVDPNWQIPHFEKMLYDNVQLITLYMQAGMTFSKQAYTDVALDAARFTRQELSLSSGELISSLSAIDDKGVEGGYYLWRDEDLEKTLNADEYKMIKLYWDMQNAAELDGGHHARIAMTMAEAAKTLGIKIEQVNQMLASIKSKLKKQQLSRVLPRDEKVIASWNGLALSAFSQVALKDKSFRKSADEIRATLVSRLWNGKKLRRAIAGKRYLGDATLEDYAYVSQGLLDYALLLGNKKDLDLIALIVEQAWKRFYSKQGWSLSEDLIAGIATTENIVADGPMPSPSAILAKVSLQLAALQQDKKLDRQVRESLKYGHEILQTDSFWYATHISALMQAL